MLVLLYSIWWIRFMYNKTSFNFANLWKHEQLLKLSNSGRRWAIYESVHRTIIRKIWTNPSSFLLWSLLSATDPFISCDPNIKKVLFILIPDRPTHICVRLLAIIQLDDCDKHDRVYIIHLGWCIYIFHKLHIFALACIL